MQLKIYRLARALILNSFLRLKLLKASSNKRQLLDPRRQVQFQLFIHQSVVGGLIEINYTLT